MYFMELCLGFHVGFMGSFNSQRKLIMDGRGIARYYVFRGNFFVDMLASVAWVAQVKKLNPENCFPVTLVVHSRTHVHMSKCARMHSHTRTLPQ